MAIANPTANLILEQQIDGTNYNTWNDRYNANYSRLDQAIAATLSVDLTSADFTLSVVDSSDLLADNQSRYAIIKATGTSAVARNIIWPIGFPPSKKYTLINASTSSVTFKIAGATGVTLPSNSVSNVVINGTDIVSVDASLASYMPLSGGTFTGPVYGPTPGVADSSTALSTTAFVKSQNYASTIAPTITGLHEVRVPLSSSNIDCNSGNFFTKTITASTTWTASNVPTSGTTVSFILELTNAGAFSETWFTGTKWAGGVAPILTSNGVDVLGFYTTDAGATWKGLILGKAVA